MKINKYLIIFFIIFLIIFSLYLLNYLLNDKKDYKEFKEPKVLQISKENFSNKELVERVIKNKEYNNLIVNGNFENGTNILNHNSQSGYNKIIMKKNPGSSSYVLEQKKTDTLTYYQIITDNDKNSKYNLYFWLSVSNNDNQNIIIEEIDFEKLIQVKIQNEDFTNYIPRLNYNIIQKVIMSSDDNNAWYLIKYDFISGPNTKDKIVIYLNYSEKLDYNYYYFTNISLYRVLIDAENFIYNNKLISYVDGYHYESNTPTWHDLSGNGNDLFWSTIPNNDLTIGSLNSLNSKLTGFPSNKISNNNFSIILCINKNYENSASDEYVNNNFTDSEEINITKEQILFSIPGNDRYSFEIKFIDDYIYLLNNGKSYKSKHEIILYNKSLIAVTYDEDIINVYYDGIIVISEKINKLYFNSSNIIVNKNKNLDYNFYSILIYNRRLEKDELDKIRMYFIENKNKNFNSPDINNYIMNNSSDFNVHDLNSGLFKAYNKKDNKNGLVDNTFIDNFDNQSTMVKNNSNSCISECGKLCEPFLKNGDSDEGKYKECLKNCKNVLPSCQNYCNNSSNENTIYCNKNNNDNICPKVFKRNGNYIIYVPPNGYYSKLLNYSGEKSYGNNLEKARYTYNTNFPKCPTPSELLPGEGKNYHESCPFIVNELNPCFTTACAGINWNVKNYNDLKLNKNCKKAVSNYCQINNHIDDKCKCWNPSYKNTPECILMRKYFEDPNDYCSPSSFNIEDHPDFNKYIKKDNIPCWGCNLNM